MKKIIRTRPFKKTTIFFVLSGVSALAMALGVGLHKDFARNNFIVRHIRHQQQNVQARARLITLNQFMPESFRYLVDVVEKGGSVDSGKLSEYTLYYQKVAQYMPNRADAQAMLGFCYYYSGKWDQAVAAYQKAVLLEPKFFISYYDLGVIFFKAKDYKRAVRLFEQALKVPAAETLRVVSSSRIYLPLFGNPKDFAQEIAERMIAGRRNCYAGIVLSHYFLKDFPSMSRYAAEAIAANLDHDGFFYYYLGAASYELKDFSKAVFFLQESIKQDPNDAQAHFYLGLSLKALGKEDLAQAALQRSGMLKQREGSPARDKGVDVRIF